MRRETFLSLMLLPFLPFLSCRSVPATAELPPELHVASRYLEVDGVRVHFFEAGPAPSDGPEHTILYVHGWHGGAVEFLPMIPQLPSSWRIVALDLPGNGYSDKAGFPFTEEYYCEFIGAFARAAGLGRFILVGHSMGGQFSIRYAYLHPQTLERLVLIAPLGLPGELKASWGYFSRHPGLLRFGLAFYAPWMLRSAVRRNTFHDASRIPPYYFPYFEETVFGIPGGVDAIREITAGVLGRSTIEDLLPQINVRTLLLWATEDRVLPYRNAQTFLAGLRRASFVPIPDSGHGPMTERPELTARAIVDFVQSPLPTD